MQGNEQGFSLLEVLVALGVLVMLLASANTLYLAGNQTLVLGEDQSELQQQARVALLKITQEIKKAGIITVQGNPARLTLILEEDNEVKTVRYRHNSNHQLIREVKKDQEFTGQTTLADFVQEAEFQQEGNYTAIKLKMFKDKVALQIQGGASHRNRIKEPSDEL